MLAPNIMIVLRIFLKAKKTGQKCVYDLFFQLMGVLPILPLLFPIMWVLVNAYGEARVLAEFSRVSPAGLVRDMHIGTRSNTHTNVTCNDRRKGFSYYQ